MKSRYAYLLVAQLFALTCLDVRAVDEARPNIRFATFNAAMNRERAGQLIADLGTPNHQKTCQIAGIIQRIQPDILLINEFDYDEKKTAADLFQKGYLGRSQNGERPVNFPYRFVATVNTGVDSKWDLNQDGKTGGPADAFGFGWFPGQYGMIVFSRFPILYERVRTFQKFLWKDMPGAKLPIDPQTGKSYYDAKILKSFRLSSKSHWDVPIKVNGEVVHFLVCHPTPPVFDGQEDRNGCRNHDEIRLFADYVSPERSHYIYDDRGRRNGLRRDEHFVIAGDMNADPLDGASRDQAILQLINHPRINSDVVPFSRGGVEQAKLQGKANNRHRGNPAHDTADFSDSSVGNVRVDYVLSSKTMKVVDSGVFWPSNNEDGIELVGVSDHRLVWIDIQK